MKSESFGERYLPVSVYKQSFFVRTIFLEIGFYIGVSKFIFNLVPLVTEQFTLLVRYFHFCWASLREYCEYFPAIFLWRGWVGKGLIYVQMWPLTYCFQTQCSKKSLQLESQKTIDKDMQAGFTRHRWIRIIGFIFILEEFFWSGAGFLKLKDRVVKWLARNHTAVNNRVGVRTHISSPSFLLYLVECRK